MLREPRSASLETPTARLPNRPPLHLLCFLFLAAFELLLHPPQAEISKRAQQGDRGPLLGHPRTSELLDPCVPLPKATLPQRPHAPG